MDSAVEVEVENAVVTENAEPVVSRAGVGKEVPVKIGFIRIRRPVPLVNVV